VEIRERSVRFYLTRTVLNREGVTENSYLFTGEQFDSNLDQYYLRARYYNQANGRFTQQDTWMGRSHDPVTLHKYLYANADPVMYVDPSGYFSLGSVGATMRTTGILARKVIVRGSQRAYGFVRSIGQILRTPAIRMQYMKRVKDLSKLADKMRKQGYSSKEIAITLNKKRLALGRLFKNQTPKFMKDRAFKRNLREYGNKWGPDIKYLREVKNKS